MARAIVFGRDAQRVGKSTDLDRSEDPSSTAASASDPPSQTCQSPSGGGWRVRLCLGATLSGLENPLTLTGPKTHPPPLRAPRIHRLKRVKVHPVEDGACDCVWARRSAGWKTH